MQKRGLWKNKLNLIYQNQKTKTKNKKQKTKKLKHAKGRRSHEKPL